MEFSGQVALVTGAARGIGAATALAFAERGADVIVNDVLDAEPLVEQIRAMGRRVAFERVDVADQAAVDAMFRRAAETMGRIDHLVANAAYSDRAPLHEQAMDGFHRTIEVTMLGAFYCLRAAARQMLAQGGGSIVLVGSPHAVVAVPNSIAYNMAKAAVDHMARTAAAELYGRGVRVNVVHPGWTDTPGERKFYSEERIAERLPTLPCGRLARPDEIARGVLFLASPDSEYVNGSTLTIDGALRLARAARP